ncbi:MAG: TetR/AcrR family transcriptional regulator [Acidimicrobiales bacterium]|jgi:AcrR family transcriptional regulator
MGRAPRIHRPAIVDAAVHVADEHGLEAMTMGAVAGRLGVTAMALYRHVKNKDALLDLVVERLLTEFPLAPAELPWPERLSDMAWQIRGVARRHPGVFPLLLQRPILTRQAWRTRDSIYRALREAGIDNDQVERTERLVSTAILGFATSEVAGRFRRHSRLELDLDFDALLAMLTVFIGVAAGDIEVPAGRGLPLDR